MRYLLGEWALTQKFRVTMPEAKITGWLGK